MQVNKETDVGQPLAELWSIQQVSQFLDIPVGTLYQWRHRGVGPSAYPVGRHLRYDSAAVRRWLVEQAA